MMDEIAEHRQRLAHAFDGEFALPLATEHRVLSDFLVVRLGVHWYAVPVDELGGVQIRKAVQPLPDAPPHCVGLAGVRGRVAAIYDLGALLGSASPDRLGWFLQTKADPEVALLVPKAEHYLRVSQRQIVPREAVDGAIVGAITDAGVAINVLSADRLVAEIHRHRGGTASR